VRQQIIREASAMPRVRVLPANAEMRRLLKHQPGGIGFRAEGSVEWPLDNFTRRCLADGSITLVSRRPETMTLRVKRSAKPTEPPAPKPVLRKRAPRASPKSKRS
jgi:hypothetical protein